MPNVQLFIDGTAYGGWKEVEVVRAIDALAGRLRLQLTSMHPLPAPRGKTVELHLNGKLIITGFLYSVSVSLDGKRHALSVTGRDFTADLVDADTMVESQEVSGLTLREIIETVVKPFGIAAIFQVEPPEKFKKFSFQQETAFDAIERACRMRGVFPSSDEKGNLVIMAYGATRATSGIQTGVNVLAATVGYDDTDRFSEYHVIGQQPGTDEVGEEEAAGPSGLAYDRAVTRYRPKIIIAEAAVDSGLAQQRAEWEATVRAAKAVTVSVTVADWEQEDGSLWRENMIVAATLPHHGVEGDMLVKEVTFTLSDNEGAKTMLALVRPDAYKKQPDLEAEESKLDDDEESDE